MRHILLVVYAGKNFFLLFKSHRKSSVICISDIVERDPLTFTVVAVSCKASLNMSSEYLRLEMISKKTPLDGLVF